MLLRGLGQVATGDKPFQCVQFQNLKETSIPEKSLVVTTVELERDIIAGLSSNDLSRLKIMTNSAENLIWVTSGGTLKAKKPESSLALGIARSLNMEQPSRKFAFFDIECPPSTSSQTQANLVAIISEMLCEEQPDLENLQHEGVLYCSRFLPDGNLNDIFRERQSLEVTPVQISEAGRCLLAIERPGQFDTLYFEQENIRELDPHHIEIHVKCIGVNAKDVYALSGRVETIGSTNALEFTGIVNRVGKEVTQFVPGDRVVAMAPSHIGTFEQVPEWACARLLDVESFEVMSTFPLVYCSAMYAIRERGNFVPGDSILIHSAAGGLGMASIQIARLLGADNEDIFATVGTESKRRFLVDRFGLRDDHIFSSRDSSFVAGILTKTGGRGVDVVINSLTGPLLHQSWKVCAEFGRFVEVGTRDILDGGRLEMRDFEKGITFTAFDFDRLYHSTREKDHRIRYQLLVEMLELLRQKRIEHITPLRVFDISEAHEAYRHFQNGARIGKVALSLERPQSRIRFVRTKYQSQFSSRKVYFMVGCLGGLGRSIARWMASQGARKFAFLSRSGLASTAAKDLMDDLQSLGAEVTIHRGNVCLAADVENAMSELRDPIGGVIHAAMDLHEVLFDAMTAENWHTGIDAKVLGTLNLHSALKGLDAELDLFLLTSSMAGAVGVATESNYCAANAFQDAFARYRRGLGLPALSLGIGMVKDVGYLHEHPQIEAWLLRKGLHPITEDELIQIIDIALANEASNLLPEGESSFKEAHILLGMETLGLQKLRQLGFEGDHHALYDPRSMALVNTLKYLEKRASLVDGTVRAAATKDEATKQFASILAVRDKGLPLDRAALADAVSVSITKKLTHLLLLQADQLSPSTRLGTFGMDSMLAAEFRMFLFTTLATEVSFQVLLDKDTTIADLTELITNSVVEGSHA